MRKLWRKFYFWYSGYYMRHCMNVQTVGFKVLLSDKLRQENKSFQVAGKIVIDILDNYLFTNKVDVSSNIKISLRDNRQDRGIEVEVRTEGAFPEKWVKYLPMPQFLWRQRISNLDRWLPQQENAIQEALKGVS